MVIAKTKEVRDNFKTYCDRAAEGQIYIIPRPQNRNVIMMSESAFNELYEMAEKQRKADYLNMLHKSVQEAEAGGFVITSIDDLEKYE
ncbi:MAG: type II toxin-antitoxin system Phd/YefM family antitoxin [Blautia sp.]|nr:type II toxin-antitoxin system Phd/YefM family antitoxin [Blautia sp.]